VLQNVPSATFQSNWYSLVVEIKHNAMVSISIQYSVAMMEGSSIKSLYEPSTMQTFIDSISITVN